MVEEETVRDILKVRYSVLLDHLGMELQLRHREYLARGRICNRRARCRLAILITIITGEGLSNTEYRKWSENNAAIRLLSSTLTRHRLQPKQNGNFIPGASIKLQAQPCIHVLLSFVLLSSS